MPVGVNEGTDFGDVRDAQATTVYKGVLTVVIWGVVLGVEAAGVGRIPRLK